MIKSHNACLLSGSIPAVGSSKKTTLGSPIKASATDNFLFIPSPLALASSFLACIDVYESNTPFPTGLQVRLNQRSSAVVSTGETKPEEVAETERQKNEIQLAIESDPADIVVVVTVFVGLSPHLPHPHQPPLLQTNLIISSTLITCSDISGSELMFDVCQ